MNEGLVKTFTAGAAVNRKRIVKFGSSDRQAILAAAATDLLMGVSDSLGAAATGDQCDVIMSGIADVEYGGTVTRGQKLTADSSGRAVTAAPAAGSNVQVIGVAQVSGVVGDIGKVLIMPSVMQG